MDINELKNHNGNPMMDAPVYGFVLLWLEPFIEDMDMTTFVHFIAGIKLHGLSEEMKKSIQDRRKKYPNVMPLDFGVLFNITLDCIIENNLDEFLALGYKLTHDQVSVV